MPKTTSLISEAAAIIRGGGLVAFPTETVYGLGANALNPVAVEKIYAAKKRPATSPLIVHCCSVEMAQSLAAEWPGAALSLALRFWPGPLTLVLPKKAHVPDRVTAGLPSVGLRIPNHPVALELIRLAEVPIAAPSANEFTQLSPTTADHVRKSLAGRVDLVLDGGSCLVGIESTVLSLAGRPVLLRPGAITREQIESVIGPINTGSAPEGPHASPGLHARHYRPQTPLHLLSGKPHPEGRGIILDMPPDPDDYARVLYARLHDADTQGYDWIGLTTPPDDPAWAAVRDRLNRASLKTEAER